jgi:hypothetical protein
MFLIPEAVVKTVLGKVAIVLIKIGPRHPTPHKNTTKASQETTGIACIIISIGLKTSYIVSLNPIKNPKIIPIKEERNKTIKVFHTVFHNAT